MGTELITKEQFKEAMPSHLRKRVDQKIVDEINNAIKDPEVLAVYRENVIGLTTVMNEGRFKISDYLKAVQFVSHKLLGDLQVQAWAKTFPDRYQDMVQRGYTKSEIGSVCSRYASSKLVTLLMGQTMMPTHILNAPLFQAMINKLADLAMNAKSEKVQSDSAGKLLDVLKPPEVQKVELDIGLKEDDSVQLLRESTMALVRQQREMIETGAASVRSIAESRLIGHKKDGEVVEGELVNDS